MFSRGPAPRRLAAVTAAVVLAALAMVTPVAAPVADAQGPGGGYHAPPAPDGDYKGGGKGDGGDVMEALWSAVRAPLRWLRQSGRSFDSLMRLLAERSVQHAGPSGEASPPPDAKATPEDGVEEAEEPPPKRPSYGGEAGAGSDRRVRVKDWQKRSEGRPERPGSGLRQAGQSEAGRSKAAPQATASTAETPKSGQLKTGLRKAQKPKAGHSKTRADVWTTASPDVSCRQTGVPMGPRGWYTVQPGDTLWHIAERHFGHGEAYRRLSRANGGRLADAGLIFPCQRLYIPPARRCVPGAWQ